MLKIVPERCRLRKAYIAGGMGRIVIIHSGTNKLFKLLIIFKSVTALIKKMIILILKQLKMKKIKLVGLMFSLFLTAFAGNKIENKTDLNNPSKEVKKTGIIHLTKAEFLTKISNFEANPTEWKYLGDKPCIIDFYASWCGPCKMIAPILEDLAKEYDGQIYIYKVDTDAEKELAAAFGISSIPSLLFCPIGEAPQMAQGAMPKEAFVKAIREVLLKIKQ